MKFEEKISFAQENLKRVNLWISHADQKIGIALLFQTGLTAFLATSKTDDIKNILSQRFDAIHLLLYMSIVFFALLILRGMFFSFKALYPIIQSKEDSLIYFGSIKNKGLSKFKKEFAALKEDESLEDLNNQTFINSQIAMSKFEDIRNAIYNTALAFPFWILILILISYLK